MENLIRVEEMANAVIEKLKEQNLLPDILDYAIPDSVEGKQEICDVDFEIEGFPRYGCEGIYVGVYLIGVFDRLGEDRKCSLITFKTLDASDAALRTMCALLAECLIAANEYKRDNSDRMMRRGFRLKRLDDVKDSAACRWHLKEQGAVLSAKPGKFQVTDLYTQKVHVCEKDSEGKVTYLES